MFLRTSFCVAAGALIVCHGSSPRLGTEAPRALVDGHRLTLIASEPEVVTPVGLAFRPSGELLVVESHTHQRQADYPGPEQDRIRRFVDSDGDNVPDRWAEDFAGGYRHALNVAVRPDGAVYVVTRGDVRLLRDTDGDGKADQEELVVRLNTEVDYPHNALGGICVAGGRLFLGMGENFGGRYDIIGSDGTTITDEGGAGRIYACDLDGARLTKFATGFWNPFGLCRSEERSGRLFCIDNDPDSSPPCRLLEVQQGDDFGFRYEYGRAGVHPLQAWDGQLPATKGMVCGVGEAATTILAYRGWLWVTSWGEHRIERYSLHLVDGELQAVRQVVVQGVADFRPTGLAVGPDGALYFADWVSRSYPVHGQGRIWRLELPESERTDAPPAVAPRSLRQRALSRAGRSGLDALRERADFGAWDELSPADRLGVLQVARDEGWLSTGLLRRSLLDRDSSVRLCGIRYTAEVRATELNKDLEALLDQDVTDSDEYLALLAAVDWLDHGTARGVSFADDVMARQLQDEELSPALRTIALRMLSPDHESLAFSESKGSDCLEALLRSEFLPLRREAVRTLALQSDTARYVRLVEIATNPDEDADVRATAVAGLASAAGGHKAVLETLRAGSEPVVAREAARVLRLTGLAESIAESKPASGDASAWDELLSAGGDPESGRRLFFTRAGVNCGRCHRHTGRGSSVGPDLTRIGGEQSRARISASILRPNEEIAPRYEPWVLTMTDGETHTGFLLPQGGDSGKETYVDTAGNSFTVSADDIESRTVSDLSIMPSGMEQSLTVEDLRDLVAFLMGDG